MNIGFGQILIIIFVGILLFGNFPSFLKDLAIGIKNFRETLKLPDKESHKDNIVEIGYKDVIKNSKSIYFENFPKKVFQWHSQGFTLPNGAKLIASNSTFKVQAFSIGKKIFGFQFHPEVDKDMISNWNNKSTNILSFKKAEHEDIQLKDHIKYSKIVRLWFEKFMKNWIALI